jgi:hypothetical protein
MDGDWSGLRLLHGGIQNLVALAAAPCHQPLAELSQLDPCFGVGWIVQNLVMLKLRYWIIRNSALQTYRVHNTDKNMEEKVGSITLQSGPHGILAVQIAWPV